MLNWVASWGAVKSLVVTSADGTLECTWELPTPLEVKRMELEELLER